MTRKLLTKEHYQDAQEWSDQLKITLEEFVQAMD